MGKKKVLFFLPKGIGGAQKMSIVISQLLPKELYDIKYVIVGKKKENDMSYLINNQSLIKRVNIINAWDFMTFRLMLILKREKPDIVFSSIVYLNIRVILAAKIIGDIKVIVRNDNNLNYHRRDMRLLMKCSYPLADVIIAQQDEMYKQLNDYLTGCASKIITLQNPIDTEKIAENLKASSPYQDGAEQRFVWAGRIRQTKGHDVLLKAFEIVHRKLPKAHCYVLGKIDDKDEYYQSLINYQQTHDLTECFHFVGFQKNPHIWEKYADCFVMPSRTEGLPNALIEAMYIGKPVVATKCIPVIDRIIEEGYNGYKVPSEDYKSMADAMIKAIELKDFKMSYKSATPKDFINLF